MAELRVWRRIAFGVGLALWCAAGPAPMACSSEEAVKSEAKDAGTNSDAADGEAEPKVTEQTFGNFELWARPIEDYLAVGEQVKPTGFNRSINDLAPFGEHMFFGYGDADYNLGEKIPIEIRFFSSKDDPAAQPALIDGAGQGAPQTTPYQSGEEQIDRFRLLDGVLWQAGIDSIDADELHTQANTTPKGIEGNVYRLDGETWRKFRSIRGGEHVHDVASSQGAVYAVGSGADTRLEFEAGQIFRYLWRSADLGQSFETVTRVQHPSPGQGDTRWVTLLPTGGDLYLFGYVSDFATNSAKISNARFDGSDVVDLPAGHALHDVFADDVLALPDGTALVWGVDVSAQPLRNTAGHVAADGSLTELATLKGSTVLDASLTETGEIVYLVLAGDEYGATPASFETRVLAALATSPDATIQVAQYTSDVEPVSIAYWQGVLFLGTGDGSVLRAVAAAGGG